MNFSQDIPETVTVQVHLTSADGCRGTCILQSYEPTEWENDKEPSSETSSAEFEYIRDGNSCSSHVIRGDQWREFEALALEDRLVAHLQNGGELGQYLELRLGDENVYQEIQIYDNGGATFDRYTVIYMEEPDGRQGLYGCRGMSDHPSHPQGFGLYSSAAPGEHLGKRITFTDLPIDCQTLILSDLDLDDVFDAADPCFADFINAGVDAANEENEDFVEAQKLLEKSFGFYINLDERGDFYADVRNAKGETVFEVRDNEDESFFEAGFMKNKSDISGLESHLKSLSVIPQDAKLMSMADFEELEKSLEVTYPPRNRG